MFVMVQMFQSEPGASEYVIGVFGLYKTRDAAEKAQEAAWNSDHGLHDGNAITYYEVYEVWNP